MNESSKEAEEAAEYLLVLADTGLAGMGRRDVNRQEHNEDAAKLREKPISDSLKGVIPDTSDPEDSYKGKSGAVGDILDSGHGFVVTSRPGGEIQRPTVCEADGCQNALLVEFQPCKEGLWLGDPMRLACKCKPCKKVTQMLMGKVPGGSVRRFCSTKCRVAGNRARKAAKQNAQPAPWYVPVEDRDPDYHYNHLGIRGRKKLKSGSWGTDCTNGRINENYKESLHDRNI